LGIALFSPQTAINMKDTGAQSGKQRPRQEDKHFGGGSQVQQPRRLSH
jgi:hypothetical protein